MIDRLTLRLFLGVMLVAGIAGGCDSLFGSKSSDTTEEIFDAGRNEPGLINEAEYVAIFPFFTQSGDAGTLQSPQDVYVGYDEFIYIVDARGLHVLDLAGRGANFIPIPGGGTSVIQDRRLHVYVTARRDTTLEGRTWNLPVVLHYDGITVGAPRLVDIIWHPFDDDSRKFNLPDPRDSDEDVAFTGVAVLANNAIYVSRRGPVNDRTSVILPHNTVLEFDRDGVNTQAIVALNPLRPSVRSSLFPSDVITFVHPPQRDRFSDAKHFVIAQNSSSGSLPLQFSVLSILAVVTSDGIEYRPDTQRLTVSTNPDRGDGFLYDDFKFDRPTDLMVASDATNYWFVLDGGKDSLFVFTNAGIEGVAPPPGSTSTIPVVVSFGGTGDGALQFRDPNGVAYFDRVVYVADTGNNRISRFKLNTDFE
jgi:NHL repeat